MIKSSRFMVVAGITALLCACQGSAENPQKKEMNQHADTAAQDKNIDMVKLSEAFGNFIGRNLQMPGIKFDLEGMIKGIRAGASGQPSPLTEKEYEEMMAAVQERAFKEMASKNMQEANEFLEKNSKAPGVTEMVPGKLQYIVVVEGKGPAVTEHSSPMINYTGKYLDGTTFGSSEETGGAITVPLDQTIQGFSKAVVGMKEGEKRKIFVHPDLGYGATGQLPPNELLIFDVEVVKANTASEAPADSSGVKPGQPKATMKQISDNADSDVGDSDDEEDEDEDDEDEDLNVPSKK